MGEGVSIMTNEQWLEVFKGIGNKMRDGISVIPAKKGVLYHDLDHLAGLWTKEEAVEFDKALAVQRKI